MTTMAVNPLAEPLRVRIPVMPAKPIANRLDVRLNVQSGVLTAHLVGDLDGDSAAVLKRKIDDLIAQGETKVALELHQLFSVDVAGLASLRDAAALLNERGGWLALVSIRPRVRHFLERTGTADQFATYKSVEDAAVGEAAKSSGVAA